MTNRIGRREALRLTVLGSVGLSALGLSACSGGSAGLDCSDVSGLSAADASFRSGQGYTERSTRSGRNCAGCNFYTAAGANACGTCTVVRGPINPEGYCNLWVARPA